jgi:ribosome recycling factor
MEIKTLKYNMEKSVIAFEESIRCIRSGTASTAMIDTLQVLCYGQMMHIKQLADTYKNGSVIDVKLFDPANMNQIRKAIGECGFNAYQSNKDTLSFSIPGVTKEERDKVIKHINKLGEEAKIAIRNIRREYRSKLNKEELEIQEKQIQQTTDEQIRKIDFAIQSKVNNL